MPDGPLIVQSDKSLLLEVDHPQSDAARRAIAPFAELERAPGARAHLPPDAAGPVERARRRPRRRAGRQHAARAFSRYPVPHALLVDVAETMSRYGRLQLSKHPVHGLVLSTTDRAVLAEVLKSKRTAGLVGDRIDDDTVSVHASERGHLKQVLVKLGWPAEDLAGYVDGEKHPIELSPTDPGARRQALGDAALPGSRPSTGSGTAAAASWCCPAARARRSSAPARWPGRARRRSSS